MSQNSILVITRKNIYSATGQDLLSKPGYLDLTLTQLTTCDIHDERQYSLVLDDEENPLKATLAFISCSKTSKISTYNLHRNKLNTHQFGEFHAEKQERATWKQRESSKSNDRAHIEAVCLNYQDGDKILAIGGWSGRIYLYMLTKNKITAPPKIDHYHGFGLNDLAFSNNGYSLITVGREPVIVSTSVTFGDIEMGEIEGHGKMRNRQFIPHLHLGMDRVIFCFITQTTVVLHQDGLVSIYFNDQKKLQTASFSNPLAITSTKKQVPVGKNSKKLKTNTESQFERKSIPMAKLGDNFVLPSGRPGTLQIVNPKENKVVCTLDVSNENFILRDEGSYCSLIDKVATFKDELIAVVEKRKSEIFHTVVKIYRKVEDGFGIEGMIEWAEAKGLRDISFDNKGKMLVLTGEEDNVYVYEKDDSWTFKKRIVVSGTEIIGSSVSYWKGSFFT